MSNQMIDGGEITLDNLIEKIFTEPVKPPKSIQISFSENKTLKEVFENLLTFLVNGMKLKYSLDGSTVDIENLTSKQIDEVKSYINSIGFNLKIVDYKADDFYKNIFPYFVQFNNMEYDVNETDLTKYQFLIQKQKCYVISFDFMGY